MKKMKWAVAVAGLVLVAGVVLVRASSYTFIGALATVNNTTTNSTALAVGTFNMPVGTFLIQNGGLSSTNALLVNVQVSVDGTNFLTVATYRPTVTNAVTDTYVPSYSAQTIYIRAQAITTNSVQVGGMYLY